MVIRFLYALNHYCDFTEMSGNVLRETYYEYISYVFIGKNWKHFGHQNMKYFLEMNDKVTLILKMLCKMIM